MVLAFGFGDECFYFIFKAEEVPINVNSWASRHTNGLIKDLLPHGSVTSETIWIYGTACTSRELGKKNSTNQ